MSYPVMNTAVPWSLVKGGFHKTPNFADGMEPQKTATGRRSTLSLKPFATWDFCVDLNLVQGGEAVQFSVLQQFIGCYLACCGRGSFFLFTDPNDNAVDDTGSTVPQSCMVNVTPGCAYGMGNPGNMAGDGVSTQFQLARTIDQGVDILQQVSNVVVLVDGTIVTPTLSTTGLVTFATPPGLNATLQWSGAFQYLCQFTDATLKDLARVSRNATGLLWSCGSVAFESVFV